MGVGVAPLPPTPGKVVAPGHRAASGGPCRQRGGGCSRGPEARAPGPRFCPRSPAAVLSDWVPNPPFLRPSGLPPACKACAASGPGGCPGPASFWKSHYGVPSQPDVSRPPSPDGLAGSSSFLSDGHCHSHTPWGPAGGSHSPSPPILRGPPGGPVFQPGHHHPQGPRSLPGPCSGPRSPVAPRPVPRRRVEALAAAGPSLLPGRQRGAS